jgi:hypothetical protein
MHKLVFRLIIVLSMALMVALPVAAQDDDDLFDFPFLRNGDSVNASFGEGYDSQLYAFVASAGDRVTIRMVQSPATSPLDPYLLVLTEFGEVIAFDDDGGDSPYFSALIRDLRLNNDGLYFVLATHKEGTRKSLEDVIGTEANNALNYTLSISGITPPVNFDADDALETFIQSEINTGQQVQMDLNGDAPVVFANFVGQRGQEVTLETSNTSTNAQVDTILMLFDTEGRRISINDDGQGIGLLSRITAELEADGRYLVLVTAYQYERTSEVSFAWTGEGSTALSLTLR